MEVSSRALFCAPIRHRSVLPVTVGRPGATRAVGTANGDNRIAVVIPCHRVIRSDGNLGGYGGRLWRKRFLLDLEGTLDSRELFDGI